MNVREGYHWRKRKWPSGAQRRVLDALVHGGSNAQIGRRLGLSFETVKWHISELLAETNLDDRKRLARWWLAQVTGREKEPAMTAEARQAFELSTIILHVGSVEMLQRCKEWYLGLGLKHSPPDNPNESVWFDTGQVLLGIHTSDEPDSGSSVTVYFNVPDVNETYKQLTGSGYVFDGPPETKGWGGRVAYLKDPGGNSVGLMTPV
jgi:predicted enzyme related to lactoylglutathione lyase/DNA-binding CsgD family transcriptional regulator